jgi:hypothetical protein
VSMDGSLSIARGNAFLTKCFCCDVHVHLMSVYNWVLSFFNLSLYLLFLLCSPPPAFSNLNADTEMKRVFGRTSEETSANKRSKDRSSHRPTRHSWFGLPRTTWPRMTERPGITMAMSINADGLSQFQFEHSQAYQQQQLQFLRAIATFDHNNVAALLRAYPYHIDSLLQMSDVCKMGDDPAMAADLVHRAMFCFECCFHTMFLPATGNCRMSYTVYENRSFFLALFRHIAFVSSRGCWRTAFELTKLLLSLDPTDDPLASLLMMDYFAIRAQEYQYLMSLFSEWNPRRQLDWLPNFSFSIALAYFLASANADSATSEVYLATANQMLQQAIIRFPVVVPLLSRKCVLPLPKSTGEHAFFDETPMSSSEKTVELLAMMYVDRAFSVWKLPGVFDWLVVRFQKRVCVGGRGGAEEETERQRQRDSVCVCVCVCVQEESAAEGRTRRRVVNGGDVAPDRARDHKHIFIFSSPCYFSSYSCFSHDDD